MTTFATAALPDVAPPDPTKHVKYTLGMVLGVDDFTQEFAYLSGRTKRVVADLLGYGVSCGLRVTVDADPDEGPRVNVAPGEAVTPAGQLVCVTPAQCAFVNEWLRANRSEVERSMSPPAAALPLYVVLCYRECATDDVPIPGEPCRSEDELMAPSRTQDDFDLELRLKPPRPGEQPELRAFVRWLAQIPVTGGAGSGPENFLADLRAALGLGTGSPPSSPPTPEWFLAAPPPPGVEIPRGDAAAYFDAALRFWTTDVRPIARGDEPGAECGCGGTTELGPDADCVLLAELAVPVVVDAISGELVADTTPIEIDELGRPTLASLSLLQEWLLSREGTEASGTVTTASGVVVAGALVAAQNGLAITALDDVVFTLTFDGFDASAFHVVTGAPISGYTDGDAKSFEVIPSDDADLVAAFGAQTGIVVRAQHDDGTILKTGFTVRIDQIGATP